MNKMRELTACLAALSCCASAWAQVSTDEVDEAEQRRYTVEIIIFRYAENVGGGSEIFLPDEPEPPADEDAPEFTDRIAPTASAASRNDRSGPLPDPELVLLDNDDFQLDEAYGRLERLDAYEPVMHFGWTQNALARDDTEAVPLYRFARPPADLDGTLTLYLSRYLHLVVDLKLRKAESIEPGRSLSRFNGFDALRTEPTLPTFYRLRESRIMKNGDLRYFDHPKFGVLARVSRVEEELPPEEGELLGYPLQ